MEFASQEVVLGREDSGVVSCLGAFVGCLYAAFLLLDVRAASARAFAAYDILEGGSKQLYLRAHSIFNTISCAVLLRYLLQSTITFY